jgi:hypothetical protein
MLTAQNQSADVDALEKVDRHSNRLRGITIQRLEFVAEFSYISGPIEKGKHVLCSFHEFFLAWKLAGFTGMSGTLLAKLYEISTEL